MIKMRRMNAKKRIVSAVLLLAVLSLAGCARRGAAPAGCEHVWERVDTADESSAAERCTKCGQTRNIYSGTDAGVRFKQFHWDGYGIGQKDVFACDLAYELLGCLSSLQETGETEPKIGKDVPVDETTGSLPVPGGTMWLECGTAGMFRLSPDWTRICKVESHLGKGEVLEMTDTLKELLRQAWHYEPYDSWSGRYENGKVSLERVYEKDSAIASLRIGEFTAARSFDEKGSLTLLLTGNEDKEITVTLRSQASDDNLAEGDFRTVALKKGKEVPVTLTFGGFRWQYEVTVYADQTRLILTVMP